MLYVNISKERKLIPSKRVKKWVNHGEVVEVDEVDRKFLGSNASALMPKEEFDKRRKRRRAKIRRRKRLRAKAALKIENKDTEKVTLKKKIKKAIKKVLPKANKPTAAELKEQRAELKEALSDKNKKDLYNFGKDVLDINSKWTDKKDSILLKILNAAKKVGYKDILKKV